MRPSRWLKSIIVLLLTLTLLVGWQLVSPAQDTTFLSSRVSRLETENSSLRSRISNLENRVAQLSSNAGIAYSDPVDVEIAPSAPLSSDPMFDRLATLAIELKERIVALEEQVADLQTRVLPAAQ